MRIRRSLVIAALTLCLLCLSGCSSKPKNLTISEMIEILPTDITTIYIDGDSSPRLLNIENFGIYQQKYTDIMDEVHCTITLQDNQYKRTVDCTLLYSYYDVGGWILDHYEVTSAQLEAICAPSQNEVDQELSLYYFDTFEFESQNFDEQAQVSHSSYVVNYRGENYSYNGNVTLVSHFYSDWFGGFWEHSLRYDDTFEWDLAGTWAGGDDDMVDFGYEDHSDAFELSVYSVSSEQREISFSARAYETSSSLFSSDRWYSREVKYSGIMQMVDSGTNYSPYDEPTWILCFNIPTSNSPGHDYAVKITPTSIRIHENDTYIGTLQKGYLITISYDGGGWPVYTKVPA